MSYSEKMIIQKMIEHTAKEQKISPALVTHELALKLGVKKIKDIKSHQMRDALMILGQYIE